jgi:pimeloyl-ACP methyl ester carboxylesterase
VASIPGAWIWKATGDIANGADDLAAASEYIQQLRGNDGFLVYGISSGALRAAMFAANHPERIARLALDAFVWPIDRDFVYSIFNRDHPGTAADDVIDAFADAITALDDSMPNGTYIDMCSRLPLVQPEQITCPTIVMRGEYDGIAGFGDLVAFFTALPNNDKQFCVMPGISHASFQQKNYLMVYHILHAFFIQPEPLYRGE